MKNIFFAIISIACFFAMSSCSSNDDSISNESTTSITLKFDQIFNGIDILSGITYTNQNSENIVFDRINYIISNIELIKENGDVYRVPKSESYFIIREMFDQSTYNITLPNIPIGNFYKIRFGVGVDETQFLLGADGQGDFLAHAQNHDMLWNWAAGYKFLAVEGSFASQGPSSNFKIHTGKTGLSYNYTEVELDLSEALIARPNFTSSVHIMTDLFTLFHGISLQEQNEIMGGEKVSRVTSNVAYMFSVHHVHNF